MYVCMYTYIYIYNVYIYIYIYIYIYNVYICNIFTRKLLQRRRRRQRRQRRRTLKRAWRDGRLLANRTHTHLSSPIQDHSFKKKSPKKNNTNLGPLSLNCSCCPFHNPKKKRVVPKVGVCGFVFGKMWGLPIFTSSPLALGLSAIMNNNLPPPTHRKGEFVCGVRVCGVFVYAGERERKRKRVCVCVSLFSGLTLPVRLFFFNS
jgi:hypothetical protein